MTGIDLDNYKPQQMQRRLGGLISSYSLSVEEYCELIQQDKDALSKLKNFITINVSEFFRDAEYFNTLKSEILPALAKDNQRISTCKSKEIFNVARQIGWIYFLSLTYKLVNMNALILQEVSASL